MWFTRLDLLAFGKFTNRQLHLGPGFHLIYGPNEAGKSTTLRAIRQLLFGIDERTGDNFVHANPSLRIGGVVCNRSGLTLEVIRRKARKDPLRAADDVTVVAETEWDQVLCGLDENTFRKRYGIDYQQLIDGGEEIAKGSGDLGEILFATGTGVMDLNAVKKRLHDEASEIFKPQGRKQKLNLALANWQQRNEAVREKLLAATTWEEADLSLQQTKRNLDTVSTKLQQIHFEADQYQRWKQARPLALEWLEFQKLIDSFPALPQLDARFGSECSEIRLRLNEATTYEVSANETLRIAEQQIQKLASPSELLTRANEISGLIAEWGSCQKGMRDRSALIEKRDEHLQTVAQLLQSIGPATDASRRSAANLDRALRNRLSTLGRRYAGLLQALEGSISQRENLSRYIQEQEELLTSLPPERSVKELRTTLRKIQADGDLELRLANHRQELAEFTIEVNQELQRLHSGFRTFDDLAAMQVPEQELLDQLINRIQANQLDQKLQRARLVDLEQQLQDAEIQITRLRQEDQIPTESDLELARSARDELWTSIRQNCQIAVPVEEKLLVEFDQALQTADTLSDRLRKEADRAAILAEQLSERSEYISKIQELSTCIAELEVARFELQSAWNSLWPGLKNQPPSPDDVHNWLAQRGRLLEKGDVIQRRQLETVALQKQIETNRRLLRELLTASIEGAAVEPRFSDSETPADADSQAAAQQLSFLWETSRESPTSHDETFGPKAGAVPAMPLRDLTLQADEMLTNAERANASRHEAADRLHRLRQEQAAAETREQTALQAMLEWKEEWHSSMEELGLPMETLPDSAANYVETAIELSDHQKQAAQLEDRIRGITADVQNFETKVRSLCAELASELIDHPVEQAMTELRDRLAIAQREADTRKIQLAKADDAQKQLTQVRLLREDSYTSVNRLSQIVSLDPLPSPINGEIDLNAIELRLNDLESVERRVRERLDHETKLKRLRTQLTQLAQSQDFSDFVADVSQHPEEDLTSRLQELKNSARELTEESNQLNRAYGRLKEQLDQMTGGTEAVDAEESRQQALAQIRSDAEDYVRLKLASVILHTAIEKYREKVRAPVLSLASEYFRELTLNHYRGLQIVEGDDGKPLLVGTRGTSTDVVSVNQMSQGTCDQLYLALRLASLQLETEPRRDVPLLIDDLLIQFDDARATAALRLLAQFSQHRQVVYFTHHEHLLRIVEQQFSDECQIHRMEV